MLASRTMPDATLSFRTSVIAPRSLLWLRDGSPVPVGGRVFDLLILLLEARGEVLTTAEILRGVWPEVNVCKENVRVQVAALRRAMGPDAELIKTVSGRGYLFAEEAPARNSTPAPPVSLAG